MSELSSWLPQFPEGRIERIYLHWSGGDYRTVYPVYHYCITWDGERAQVERTNDLRLNMRDVREEPERPYVPHTAGRNSYAAGLAVMGMKDARPDDFGPYPLVDEAVEALCRVAGAVASFYRIPIDAAHVLTHAEAALEDGYFGDGDDERWDIARLHPSVQPLSPGDALQTGQRLRDVIAQYVVE